MSLLANMGGSELIDAIPTVDLSSFFEEGNESGKEKAKETIAYACRTYGFFWIVNQSVPAALMRRAIKLSKAFFNQTLNGLLQSALRRQGQVRPCTWRGPPLAQWIRDPARDLPPCPLDTRSSLRSPVTRMSTC